MPTYNQTVPLTQAKQHMTELIQGVEDFQDVVAITKNGFPTAVLLNLHCYEGLLETLEVLSDPELVKTLLKAKREIKAGKLLDWDKASA